MKTTKITCDHCGNDITYTSNCDDFRVVLSSEAMAHTPGGGAVTLMYVTPQFPQPHYFCGERCLVRWILAEYTTLVEMIRTNPPGDA